MTVVPDMKIVVEWHRTPIGYACIASATCGELRVRVEHQITSEVPPRARREVTGEAARYAAKRLHRAHDLLMRLRGS